MKFSFSVTTLVVCLLAAASLTTARLTFPSSGWIASHLEEQQQHRAHRGAKSLKGLAGAVVGEPEDSDESRHDLLDWNNGPKFAATRTKLLKKGLESNCTEKWFTVTTNHFEYVQPLLRGAPETFQMRYYECMDKDWKDGDTIFYYTGNEAPIEFFMDWTGLMWENAKAFGAKLVWAEHRYFGKSLPFANESMPKGDKLRYLSPDQALADYAAHINYLRYEKGAANSSIIGFGGSYGGMLCGWMRGKYPYALDGCLASSAPVGTFAGVHPAVNTDHAAMIATEDASPARGAAPHCVNNSRLAFQLLASYTNDTSKLKELSDMFQVCTPLSVKTGGTAALMNWARTGLIILAQSSFPFPNNLLLVGASGMMPPYPLRAACDIFGNKQFEHETELLSALATSLQILFNTSKTRTCNFIEDPFPVSKVGQEFDYLWGYLSCTTLLLKMTANGKEDMFFDTPYNLDATIAGCRAAYGADLQPQPEWVQLQFGGRSLEEWGTNIIFSSGQYDPVRQGSITNTSTPTNLALVVPECGHTCDLAFSTPEDTPGMTAARQSEMAQIWTWVKAKTKRG